MIHSIPLYLCYIGAIVLSAIISAYSVKKIIFIARSHKIYDVPDDKRKIHGAEIPTLGGIGIFVGYVVVAAFFWPKQHFFMPYVLTSSVVLFFTGIYDDIMNMRPSKKLVAQLIASFITIYFADVRFESLYGLFGIGAISYWPGIIITTLSCTFFINVFNFVDGIDGLAGVLSILYLAILGYLLAYAGMYHENAAGICFALVGATIGLLIYNIAPAKIYMGDTGSMFLGFNIFIFSLLLINWLTRFWVSAGHIDIARRILVFIFAMLFLPIFDAVRVFILRASRGISPLKADRSHLHYYLLDAGFGHTAAVVIITGINILLIGTAVVLMQSPYLSLAAITVI